MQAGKPKVLRTEAGMGFEGVYDTMKQDKSFEEQFPSLKGKEVQFPLEFWIKSMKLDFGTNNLHLFKDDVYGIPLKDIQQHCLDKQKVRDALKKWIPKIDEDNNVERLILEIEKELKL